MVNLVLFSWTASYTLRVMTGKLNWYKRRQFCNAFMNAVPDLLHWKLAGHCHTDLLNLATLADNILLYSKNRRNRYSDHSFNFSSSVFSSTHSQSTQTFPKNLSLLCKHKCMKCKPACLVWQQTRQSRGITRRTSKTLQILRLAAEITLHSRVLLHKSNRWTHLTIPRGASITTVSKKTPVNAKILTATQRTFNQVSSKLRLHTQNQPLPIRSKTRTIRTGVTTTTSSEIAHETAQCLVRTLPKKATPGSFRNFLLIVSVIRYSDQETNFPTAFLCLTLVLVCLFYQQHHISSSVQERVMAK